MTDQSLVLVWEENPDAVRLYQVPSHKKICAIMRAAHGQIDQQGGLAGGRARVCCQRMA